jgi:hypothetical protein
LGKDFDDTVGKAVKEAACGLVVNTASVHFQNVLGGN